MAAALAIDAEHLAKVGAPKHLILLRRHRKQLPEVLPAALVADPGYGSIEQLGDSAAPEATQVGAAERTLQYADIIIQHFL